MSVLSVPHLNSNVKTFSLLGSKLHNSDVKLHVGQVLDNLTSFTSNSDFSGLNCYLDYKITSYVSYAMPNYLPPSGIWTKSSVRMDLMLLISSFINK